MQDAQGIESEARRPAGGTPGQNDSLVRERCEAVEQRLWAMFSPIPKDISLVDELIAERRAEAAKEAAEE